MTGEAPSTTLEQSQLDGILSDFHRLESRLNRLFGEREEMIRTCLLGILANEHVYLVGPPGTAKSLIVRTVAGAFPALAHYETLLHGGSRLSGLLRGTGDRLQDSHFVFLDEIFRAPKDLLLSLLSFMNERTLYDPDPKPAALLTLFGASNQNPSPQDGLEAFYDRFTYRCLLRPIESRERFFEMAFAHEGFLSNVDLPDSLSLSAETLTRIPSLCRKRVSWKESAREELFTLRRSLYQEGIFISDRRWKKVVLAVTMNALYQGADTVHPGHFYGIKNVLWSYPTEVRTIERILSCYRS